MQLDTCSIIPHSKLYFVLGWLNCHIELKGEQTDWDTFVLRIMQDLSQQFDSLNASVGHVKMILEAGQKSIISNLTGRGNTLNISGSSREGHQARLTLNARVEMSPEVLEQIVRKTIDVHTKGSLSFKIVAMRSLSPGRPNPTYRFNNIVFMG